MQNIYEILAAIGITVSEDKKPILTKRLTQIIKPLQIMTSRLVK